jgi:hypothetical protein
MAIFSNPFSPKEELSSTVPRRKVLLEYGGCSQPIARSSRRGGRLLPASLRLAGEESLIMLQCCFEALTFRTGRITPESRLYADLGMAYGRD